MADETTTPETTDETQAPTQPSQPPERVFTQAEVTALLTKERQRGKRQAIRESTKETQTETDEPALADRVTQLAEQLESERKAREFLEAWASVPNASRFTSEQRQAIRDTWKEGVSLTDHVGVLYPTAPVAEPPETTPAVKPPAYSPDAAPAGAPQDAATNPLLWTKDDIARLRSQRDANGRSLFLSTLDKWADTLPGGGSPFRRRLPKG